MKIARKTLIFAMPFLVLLVCAVCGIRYLQSERFQEYVRSALISKFENATGLNCKINRLRVDVFGGRFVMRGVDLTQRGTAAGLVHLQIPEISASLSISSVWHFRIRLHELTVVQPRLELISGGGDSSWNPDEMLRNLKISLRLEASKVRVQNGWVKLNKNTSPFNFSVDDFAIEIAYEKKLPSYEVRIKYGRSRLFWKDRDIVHGLDLNVHVSLQGIAIDSFQFRRSMTGTNTVMAGNGSLIDWKSPVLNLHLAGTLDTRDLVLATPSLYEGKGNIQIVGDLRNDQKGIYSKGKFLCRTGSYRKMNFKSLAGIFEIQNDVLYLRN